MTITDLSFLQFNCVICKFIISNNALDIQLLEIKIFQIIYNVISFYNGYSVDILFNNLATYKLFYLTVRNINQ